MHIHHQPPDIRGLHLIARLTVVVAAICAAGVAGHLRALGG